MVRAWYLNAEQETDISKMLDLKELHDATGALSWQLNLETYEEDGSLDKIRNERGYLYTNIIDISPEGLPDYEAKVKSFHKEHYHEDEEVHLALKGSAYFDLRSHTDEWIRIELVAGDLLVLPPAANHRLTLIEHQRIKMLRLFVGEVRSVKYRHSTTIEMGN